MPQRNSKTICKLYKLRPLISHLNDEFYESFQPGRNLSIDESMVWVIADAKTENMLKFSVYECKSTGSVDDTLGARVVKDLWEKYIDKGYCLYFDNVFSTFDLVKGLLERKIFCCGTFRSDRKRYSCDLKTK
ncbi:hypothetical protein JTB14_022064 [Gonioctena quinquepunctata]|nr:hypothetical protein JTB14_022064 [Gonioctena quinquepunctata]